MRRRKGLSFYQKKKKISASVMKEIWNVIFITIACWMLAFVLMFCFGMRTTVIGVSMEPSLYNGQHILVNRFVYKLSSPKNGDIVVFLPNGNSNTHYYVKRVIAVPGDTKATTLAGIIADESAIGMVNQKTTAVRLIPVIGKDVGDTAEFGGLLGYAPIIPVNEYDCSAFVSRKGRIPAPVHSFKN